MLFFFGCFDLLRCIRQEVFGAGRLLLLLIWIGYWVSWTHGPQECSSLVTDSVLLQCVGAQQFALKCFFVNDLD